LNNFRDFPDIDPPANAPPRQNTGGGICIRAPLAAGRKSKVWVYLTLPQNQSKSI
jgi:hypothetical protein